MSKKQKCTCYKNYRGMKAHLPGVTERLKDLTEREPFVAGILLEGVFDLLKRTIDIEDFLDRDFTQRSNEEIEALEKKIIDCADCPAAYHYKKRPKKFKRRHSTT